jgi:hypothetical protein
MDEIEDDIYVEGIVKEWQMYVPFINRGMKHSCVQFADNTPISYADELIFTNNLELMNNWCRSTIQYKIRVKIENR